MSEPEIPVGIRRMTGVTQNTPGVKDLGDIHVKLPGPIGFGTSQYRSKNKTCESGDALLLSPSNLKAWTECDQLDYQNWVSQNALKYVAMGDRFKLDCADWAFFCLISFARTRKLNIKLTMGAFSPFGPLARLTPDTTPGVGILVNLDNIDGLYTYFESVCRKRFGAADLHALETYNCKAVASIEGLLPGDIIASTSHIQVVHAVNSTIDVQGEGQIKVLEITQGSLAPGADDQLGGVAITHRAWDMEGAHYFDCTEGVWKLQNERSFREEYKDGNWVLRRWNYDMFSSNVYIGFIEAD